MKKILVLLCACILSLAACASPGLKRDCLERKSKAEQVAGQAARLFKGLSTMEVRALLGEPDEIVTAKGVGELEIWKYYLWEDCRTHLGMVAPTTELYFVKGLLLDWQTYVK